MGKNSGSSLERLDHDGDPKPESVTEPVGKPEDEPGRRHPRPMWDRSKFLVLLGIGFFALAWAAMADDPILPFSEAVRHEARAGTWLVALFGLELVRQVHYLISEHWAGWHRFWTVRFFGGIERRTRRLNDWNRYRIGRLFRYLVFVVVLAVVLGKIFHEPPSRGLFHLPAALFKALPMVLQVVFIMLIAVGQFVAIFWFLSRGGMDVYFPDDIKTRFTDVWGQDAVLDRVKENIVFLENPEAIEEKGGYVPGGLLLWGPPGTGKTLMAEAVAGETGKPFMFVEPGAFINMFFGIGVLKVKSLFRKLRKLAVRYGGVIVFFDEADALGNRGQLSGGFPGGGGMGMGGPSSVWAGHPACNGVGYLSPHALNLVAASQLAPAAPGARPGTVSRFIGAAGMGGGGGMGTLQALLTEMSGLKKPRGFVNRFVRRALGMRPKPPPKYRILIMMATNMPQALDEALLRPGRLDRLYRVGYPSKEGRKRTYKGYLDKVRHEITDEQVDKLAVITPYATGASIKDLVNEALVVAIRDGRDTITWPDLIKAKLLKTLGPPDDVEYIERERHAVAVHEACHAVAAFRLRKHLAIDIATIEKGQNYLGMVASIPFEEQFTQWRTEFEADVMVSIASLVGERMLFEGDNSSGVSEDLRSATTVAMYMEGHWGMGTTVGSHAVAKGEANATPIVDGTSRNMLETELGARVEAKLAELYRRTERLLEANRAEIMAVAHALETHKTLTGDDVVAVIEGAQGALVDGRPYQQPAFLALAEEYHTEAVQAHRDKTRVEKPLPHFSADGHGNGAQASMPPDDHGNGAGVAGDRVPVWADAPPAAPRRPRRRRQPGGR